MDAEFDKKFSYAYYMPLYLHTNIIDKNTGEHKLVVMEENKLCNHCKKQGIEEKCYGKTHKIFDHVYGFTHTYNFKKD